jgi:hypothetical protein
MLLYCTSAYSDPEPLASFLALAAHARRHGLTEKAEEADAIFFVENSRYHEDAFFSRLRKHPLLKEYRDRCFLYNEHDRPWCLLPGVYCSMPQKWFDRSRQRATRYIRLLNPLQIDPAAHPDLLFSFLGNSQILLRRKILELKHPRALLQNTSSFPAFFEKALAPEHQSYAEVMQRSKFVACPRGGGTSSVRLFETLRAGRVPIIISDQWVAPDGPDWASCSIHLAEQDIDELPRIAEEAEERWPQMAQAARQVWEEWFADEVLFDRVADCLVAIQGSAKPSNPIMQRIPSMPELDWRLRRSVRSALSQVGRNSPHPPANPKDAQTEVHSSDGKTK